MADEQGTGTGVSLLDRALAQEPKVKNCRQEYGKHEWVTHDETGVDFCRTCSMRRDVWEGQIPDNNGKDKGKGEYEVGYGKPPVEHQIKPGEVRNPNGRPKGSRNLTTIVMEAMRGKVITVKLPDGSTAKITGEEAFAEAVLENALKKKDRESLRMIWEMHDGKPTQQHRLDINGARGYEIAPERERMIINQFNIYDGDVILPSEALKGSTSVPTPETTQTPPTPQIATPTPAPVSEGGATTPHATDIPPIIKTA